jgi:hypothetical protein
MSDTVTIDSPDSAQRLTSDLDAPKEGVASHIFVALTISISSYFWPTDPVYVHVVPNHVVIY